MNNHWFRNDNNDVNSNVKWMSIEIENGVNNDDDNDNNIDKPKNNIM